MTTIKQFKQAIVENGNSVYFTYNGKPSGVEPTVKDSVFTFEMWYGQKYKVVAGFDNMITDAFFDGKTLTEVAKLVTVDFR